MGASPEVEIDLVRLLFACLHRWYVFVILGALGTAIAIAISVFYLTPLYQSSISLYVNNRLEQGATDYVSTSDMSASRSLVSTYITICKSDRVLGKVADALDGQFSAAYLKSVVAAKQQGTTELFTVTVTTTDPERSSMIANAMADVFPSVLSEIVEGSSAKVIDYGKVPKTKSYPSNSKNALIGLLIGVVLAGIFVLLEFITDVRIMDEEDLGNVSEYPLLGQIPDFSQIGKRNLKSSRYGYASPESSDKDESASEEPKKADENQQA